MGVGITGIKARLRQFGGELVVRSGRDGTRLHGVMPVHAMSPGVPETVAPLSGGHISSLALRAETRVGVLHHRDTAEPERGADVP